MKQKTKQHLVIMNNDLIQKAAQERWPSFKNSSYSDNARLRSAFITGAHFVAENPDVIGCVKVEEAMRFAEWVFEMDWIYDFGYKWSSNDGHYKTSADLFDIYKQQKP